MRGSKNVALGEKFPESFSRMWPTFTLKKVSILSWITHPSFLPFVPYKNNASDRANKRDPNIVFLLNENYYLIKAYIINLHQYINDRLWINF